VIFIEGDSNLWIERFKGFKRFERFKRFGAAQEVGTNGGAAGAS
jgi:hypothetical protein